MNDRQLREQLENGRKYFYFSQEQQSELMNRDRSVNPGKNYQYESKYAYLDDGRIEEFTQWVQIEIVGWEHIYVADINAHKGKYKDSVYLGEGVILEKAIRDFISYLETTEFPRDPILISKYTTEWAVCCSCKKFGDLHPASDGHLYCGKCRNELVAGGAVLTDDLPSKPDHDCSFEKFDDGSGDDGIYAM